MIYKIKIKRQKSPTEESYIEEHEIADDGSSSVAMVLRKTDVAWECGCLIQKCGACAMRINGRPRLACAAFLSELGQEIMLEPLSKFPLVRDLIVDRSFIYDALAETGVWLDDAADMRKRTHEVRHESARCLMCGCCLEVCPNFSTDAKFAGALTAVNAFRIIDESRAGDHAKDLKKRYKEYYFRGCGKSLACHDICPIDLPVEEMIVRSNAMAIWGKKG